MCFISWMNRFEMFSQFPFWEYAWLQLEPLCSYFFIWTGSVCSFKSTFSEKSQTQFSHALWLPVLWLNFWMNRFNMFLQFPFLKISKITELDLLHSYLFIWSGSVSPSNWLFQKIIATTLARSLISCLYENNWHIFVEKLIS